MIVAAMTCWGQTQEHSSEAEPPVHASSELTTPPAGGLKDKRKEAMTGPTTISSIGMGKGSFFL